MRSKGGGNFLQRRSNAGFGAFSKDVKLEHGKNMAQKCQLSKNPIQLICKKIDHLKVPRFRVSHDVQLPEVSGINMLP